MEEQKNTWFAFDTVNTVSFFYPNSEPIKDLLEISRRSERFFNKFREGSDIWNINHAHGHPVRVSGATEDIIRLACRYSVLTDGAFDISIGSVNWLWDFKSELPSVPDMDSLTRCAQKVNFRQIQIGDGFVQVPEGMQLDLGGIAKGYIADRMADCLRGYGVCSGMLNLGGNVFVIGDKPDGSHWQVGIRSPANPEDGLCAVLFVSDSSIVTSGIYERSFQLDGACLHHILNVHTGEPIQNDIASVTVVSSTSAYGDALSTASICLGMEESISCLKHIPDVEALFVSRSGKQIWTGDPACYQSLEQQK